MSVEPIHPEDYPDVPVYNTKAASLRTGVPADTIRAWERRYGVPKPQRTPGAQRLYSERDIASIRWLKHQTATGVTIKQAVQMLKAVGEQPPIGAGIHDHTGVEDAAWQLFRALTGLDAPQAERVLSRSFAEYGVETTCLGVIQPALYRIGEEWETGSVPVSVEHFSSYFIRNRLTGLINLYGQGGTLGPVITACAPTEQHEIGALILAIFLMRRGVRVVHLGADVPLSELVNIAERWRPRLICLSASTPERAELLVRCMQDLERRNGSLPQICYGGFAFKTHPELRDRVRGVGLDSDALEAADTIVGLLSQVQ